MKSLEEIKSILKPYIVRRSDTEYHTNITNFDMSVKSDLERLAYLPDYPEREYARTLLIRLCWGNLSKEGK